MSFSLHSLPAELLLEIGDYLDAASVCTLRLASKASNEAFTPALFRFLKVLTVDIEESVLRSLSVLSGHPVLGAAVRRLDLICLYFIERPRETEDFRMTNDVYRKMDGYVMNDDEADPVAAERRAWIRERKLEQAEFQGQQMCAMLTSLLRGGFVNLDTVSLEAFSFGRQGLPAATRISSEDLLAAILDGRHPCLPHAHVGHLGRPAAPQPLAYLPANQDVQYPNTRRCSIPLG